MPLIDVEHGIIGNCDLPYWDDQGRVVVTEIKSMKGDDWKVLRRPLPKNIFQATAYNRLFEANGYPVAPYIRLLYVTKNYVIEKPYKEFIVPMDRAVNNRLDRAWAKAKIIKGVLETGVIPPRLEGCEDVRSMSAKRCETLVPCFARR